MHLSERLAKADQLSRKHLHLSLISLTFWVVYCLLLIIHCVENTSLIYQNLPWINGMYLFRNILYVVLLMKAGFLTTYRAGQLWSILGVLLAAGLCVIFSGDFTFMEFAIIAIAAKDISPRRVVKVFAVIKATALVMTLMLYSANILPTIYYENSTDVNNTFGFCHRNVLGANVYILCLCWFYLRYQKLSKWDYIVWAALSVATYLLADSRTTLLIMAVTIALFWALRMKETAVLNWPHLRKALPAFFLGLFLVSLICTIFYKRYNEFWEFVDTIFTKRLRFSHQCYAEYGLSLFGARIDFVSTLQAQNDSEATRLILDNAYMRSLLYDGIIPCMIMLIVYIRALVLGCKRKHGALIGTLLVMAVCGFSERFMLDVHYNFPLLVACITFFRCKKSTGDTTTYLPFEYAAEVLKKIRSRFKTTFPDTPEAEQ